MLENRALFVRPGKASERRLILAADTGDVVGFARWRVPEPGAWWRPLLPRVLEVRELEDEPLLCTVRRGWALLPWYDVRDADEHSVGRFLGPVIQDYNHCRCAVLLETGPGRRTFRNPGGTDLAHLTADPEGLRLVFEEVVEKEPFIKMLLLAAVLAG